ncbi:FMN-binding protein [Acetobacterium paludosum]|uniref:FMN-binding protein n=1 Tax=Acetobacterium paludosum TaxID=52693 RepID=A0A923HZJ9_9FIRM|nr:FMN-binding protein [Acetobacterium paludosum]MBC3890005.1 FMN-binding protein [Acetobacterium paludosum]
MKKALIIILVILGVIILAIGGGILYISNGLESGKNLVINSVDPTQVADGVYTGSYQGGRWSNEVEVTVSEKKITQINVIKSVNFEKPEVTNALINNVIEKQNTLVDSISGATVTSKAYLKSIENALSN